MKEAVIFAVITILASLYAQVSLPGVECVLVNVDRKTVAREENEGGEKETLYKFCLHFSSQERFTFFNKEQQPKPKPTQT